MTQNGENIGSERTRPAPGDVGRCEDRDCPAYGRPRVWSARYGRYVCPTAEVVE